MGKMGSFDLSGMKELQKDLQKLQDPDAFLRSCAEELAARLLRMVVKRTPVGDYSHEVEVVAKRDSKNHKKGDVYKKKVNPSGKVGGTLRRGWTIGEVRKEGNIYKIDIINPVGYSSYVEFGHRTQDHKGWVKGKFMMTISEQELRSVVSQILERKVIKYLGGAMK